MRASDMERVSAVAFRRWCAEEMVDPRLEDILEEAFVAGFIAREKVEWRGSEMAQLLADSRAVGAMEGN